MELASVMLRALFLVNKRLYCVSGLSLGTSLYVYVPIRPLALNPPGHEV